MCLLQAPLAGALLCTAEIRSRQTHEDESTRMALLVSLGTAEGKEALCPNVWFFFLLS